MALLAASTFSRKETPKKYLNHSNSWVTRQSQLLASSHAVRFVKGPVVGRVLFVDLWELTINSSCSATNGSLGGKKTYMQILDTNWVAHTLATSYIIHWCLAVSNCYFNFHQFALHHPVKFVLGLLSSSFSQFLWITQWEKETVFLPIQLFPTKKLFCFLFHVFLQNLPILANPSY